MGRSGWAVEDGVEGVEDFGDFYNRVRPHETLDQTLLINRYLAQPDNNETEEAILEPA